MSWLREYIKNNAQVGAFGIKYLDDALTGILKGDLIIIGARSGAGKTTLSNIIARANARLNKKIALFTLENFKNDNLAEEAYNIYKSKTKNYDITLREFISGNIKFDEEFFSEAEIEAEEAYKNITLINRQAGYDIEKLKEDIIKQAQAGIDLIIIDHLDYIEKMDDNDTDIVHVTTLMRTIREAQNATKVAIVAMSHLRKNWNSKETYKIPSMDEFIGSSNKVKEATCVIMFAPDDDENYKNAGESHRRSTWCCIRKLRTGGIDNTAAKLVFNSKINQYEPFYTKYKVNYSGTKVEEIKAF